VVGYPVLWPGVALGHGFVPTYRYDKHLSERRIVLKALGVCALLAGVTGRGSCLISTVSIADGPWTVILSVLSVISKRLHQFVARPLLFGDFIRSNGAVLWHSSLWRLGGVDGLRHVCLPVGRVVVYCCLLCCELFGGGEKFFFFSLGGGDLASYSMRLGTFNYGLMVSLVLADIRLMFVLAAGRTCSVLVLDVGMRPRVVMDAS